MPRPAARAPRRARALLLLLAALGGPARAEEPAGPLALEVPGTVDGLRLDDVDGDGRVDVLALSGRTVRVWTARADGLPAPAPTFVRELPPEVTYVDVDRAVRPALLGLGAAGTLRVRLNRTGPEGLEPLPGGGLGWRDGERAVFAPLQPGPAGDARRLAPGAAGWELHGDGAPRALGLALRREVRPSGAFLEQSTEVDAHLPRLVAGAAGPDGAPPLLWALAGDRLACFTGPGPLGHDLAFLPPSGERRLADLDGDGTPDLLHRDGDNRETRYAFFRVPPPVRRAGPDGAAGFEPPTRELRPPAAFLRLSGFNLDPEHVDLDGDGRLDLVVTTIPLDTANTLRAVASGKVAATTLCFRQRPAAPDQPLFPSQPDASVASDIGVRIRFGAAGNIDVTRSFTILAGADLDGDGRRDLLIRAGPDSLDVRAGTAEGVWAAAPRRVGIPPLAPGEELEAHAADLDGRPGDELLLHYRRPATPGEKQPDRLVLFRVPR